jgi:hypothetical protein
MKFIQTPGSADFCNKELDYNRELRLTNGKLAMAKNLTL